MTIHTITVKYVHKNTMHTTSYSFLTYAQFDKALDIIRRAASYSNSESNIVEYDWAFHNSVKTSEDMITRMKATTNIKI